METPGSSGGSFTKPGNAGPPRGLAAEILSLIGSVGRHAQSLGDLAGEEAREAAELGLRLVVMLAAALFFAAFGYVLLIIAAAFFIAAVFHVGWVWILPGFVLLHLILAFVCANHVRTHWRTPLFPATRSEISRDLDALGKGRTP